MHGNIRDGNAKMYTRVIGIVINIQRASLHLLSSTVNFLIIAPKKLFKIAFGANIRT